MRICAPVTHDVRDIIYITYKMLKQEQEKETPDEEFSQQIVNDLRRSNDKIKDIQELIDTLDYYIIYKQTSLIVIDELYTKRLILDYIRANFIDSEQFNS